MISCSRETVAEWTISVFSPPGQLNNYPAECAADPLVPAKPQALPRGSSSHHSNRWQAVADVLPKLMQRLGLRERLRETEVIDAWSKIVGEFIAAHSAPVALRDGILYVRVLQPALHYELEQISKPEILRKLKQRFGGKIIRDIRFRVG
jgi:predicted nucleic acid-binding Zn ribbon protein